MNKGKPISQIQRDRGDHPLNLISSDENDSTNSVDAAPSSLANLSEQALIDRQNESKKNWTKAQASEYHRQISSMFKEEKELTYAQNLKQQRQFLRFLVTKLHTVNAMCDEINRDYIFDQTGSLIGSCFGWSDAAGSYSMNNRGKKEDDSKQPSQQSTNTHDLHDQASCSLSQSPFRNFSDYHDPYTSVPYI